MLRTMAEGCPAACEHRCRSSSHPQQQNDSNELAAKIHNQRSRSYTRASPPAVICVTRMHVASHADLGHGLMIFGGHHEGRG